MRYGIDPALHHPATTIRVRMTRSIRAVVAPATEQDLVEGQEYDLPEDLAEALFRGHDADPAEAHAQHASPVDNSLEIPPSQSGVAEPPSAPASKIRARRGK